MEIRKPEKARMNILLINVTLPSIESLKVQVCHDDYPTALAFDLVGSEKPGNLTSLFTLPRKLLVKRFLDLIGPNFTLMRNIARPSSGIRTGTRNVNVLDDHRNVSITALRMHAAQCGTLNDTVSTPQTLNHIAKHDRFSTGNSTNGFSERVHKRRLQRVIFMFQFSSNAVKFAKGEKSKNR
jgi:hypothetical protein